MFCRLMSDREGMLREACRETGINSYQALTESPKPPKSSTRHADPILTRDSTLVISSSLIRISFLSLKGPIVGMASDCASPNQRWVSRYMVFTPIQRFSM